ncbi:LOW QUALITY PROTEIN: hypothetical protein HID58_044390 [Brassica napus]|uniref:Uncharacterized protein n=1 Tax=Brassica napus TaxID=3708 RepID=A0ABQ8BJ79_BRANA|nr:LOW QUALITY PROTEIN: hypothetical protein HID58_044390 [Brassica napus]
MLRKHQSVKSRIHNPAKGIEIRQPPVRSAPKEVTSGREGPIFSKSSGESSVPFHRENSFQKKNCSPGRIREARSSGASQESPSIFQRLGDAAFDSTQEARSTKGSRSPPSALSSSEKKRKTAGISTSKRRRLSGSDDRRVKKAKVDTLDDHSTPPSHMSIENARWPSGRTERFSHTTTRGRQFDTQGQRGGTGLAKKSLRRFLARWPFGNVRWPSGRTERFSHTTTRGCQFDTQGQRGGTGLAKKSLRGFLARWPFGVSPVTIKSSTHKVLRTSGGLVAGLNVSHTRLSEVASSILRDSGVELG